MYNWFAVDNVGELKGARFGLPASHTWVWTEGTPSDIDICDRVSVSCFVCVCMFDIQKCIL